jgi:hypothetical protein
MICGARCRDSNLKFQIRVATRTNLVAHSGNVDAAAMFHVAFGTTRSFERTFRDRVLRRATYTNGLMRWAVVASKAGAIRCVRGILPSRRHMAHRALPFQNRVRRTQSSARVRARILCHTSPCNPNHRQQRRQHAKPKTSALECRRPFEIVQVDPLRQLLRCPRSRHLLLVPFCFLPSLLLYF